MNFIIKKTEPQLFTVGTEDVNGNFEPFEDFETRKEAKEWILSKQFPKPEIKKLNEIILEEVIPNSTPGKKIVQKDGVFEIVLISAFPSQNDKVIASFKYAEHMIRYLCTEYYHKTVKVDGSIATYGY